MALVVGLVCIASTALATTTAAPTISETKAQITDPTQPTSYQLNNPTPQNLKDYLGKVVVKYGNGDDLYTLSNLIQCESGWNPNAHNPTSAAFGIAQFMPSTFSGYCGGNYFNPYDQIKCLVIAWTANKQNWWAASKNCWENYITR